MHFCNQADWVLNLESSSSLITPARLAVLSLMSTMQFGQEIRRIACWTICLLRSCGLRTMPTEDAESHTGVERLLRQDGRKQEREEQLSAGGLVQDAGVATGACSMEGSHLVPVGNGRGDITSTGFSKGLGLKDLLLPSHLASEAP